MGVLEEKNGACLSFSNMNYPQRAYMTEISQERSGDGIFMSLLFYFLVILIRSSDKLTNPRVAIRNEDTLIWKRNSPTFRTVAKALSGRSSSRLAATIELMRLERESASEPQSAEIEGF